MSLALPRPVADPPTRPDRTDDLRGILLTLLSAVIFSCTNTAAKWVMHDIPTGELLFLRGVVALAFVAALIPRRDVMALMHGGQLRLHLLRVVCSCVEVFCFYWVIARTPLADMTAIYLASPIYVTAMAAVFLRERVGWRRWAAVCAGFVGVLLALRPTGQGLSPAALVGVMGSVLYAVSLVATRRLRATPSTMLVATQMAGLLVLSASTIAWGWVMPSTVQFAAMIAIGLASMVAFWCVNQGLRLAPASAVVPINYSSILWATALGWLVFGDIPALSTLIGSAIIMAAGLSIMLRFGR